MPQSVFYNNKTVLVTVSTELYVVNSFFPHWVCPMLLFQGYVAGQNFTLTLYKDHAVSKTQQ